MQTPALIRLEASATPRGIITLDSPNPCEIDDGLRVRGGITGDEERYKVRIYAADTSPLYYDDNVTWQVLQNLEAKYRGPSPDSGRQRYTPMIDPDHIRRLELKRDTIQTALFAGFTIGTHLPPTNIHVGYESVDVGKNYSFHDFAMLHSSPRKREEVQKYSRAASLIIRHLSLGGSIEEEVEEEIITDDSLPEGARRSTLKSHGSKVNAAFMIAANHVFASTLIEHDFPGIFRLFNLGGSSGLPNVPANFAWFSTEPGNHDSFGFPYARGMSPLRRGDDFVEHGFLHALITGRKLTKRDFLIRDTLVGRLNRRITERANFQRKKAERLTLDEDELPIPMSA